jgi:uncharacterized protein YutE (UPF0331/DUF86 family)
LVDPDVVRRRLRQIDRRVAALRAIAAGREGDFVDDDALQAQAERHLQVAVQSAIDIALHILAEDSSETPEDYATAFLLLARIGLIDRPLADRLRSAAGLRNVLVHTYLDVDPRRLWAHLRDLDDLIAFAAAVESYVQRSG